MSNFQAIREKNGTNKTTWIYQKITIFFKQRKYKGKKKTKLSGNSLDISVNTNEMNFYRN